MDMFVEKVGVVQNLGLADRVIRGAVGIGILGAAYYSMVFTGATVVWETYAILFSIYPIITSILGWDPVYQLFHGKSCSLIGRNQCGTLPYEIKTAFMKGEDQLICETDKEHTLESCHDHTVIKPHHKVWQVDREPMIYPSDRDLDKFIKAHKKHAA